MSLQEVWQRLCQVRVLTFVARSSLSNGWNGQGSGTVVVERGDDDGVITFAESGVWRNQGDRDLRFSNVFRWSRVEDTLRLEHLRFGADHPVYLFDLAAAGDEVWRSVSPHLCSKDCYTAVLLVRDDHIILRWSIDGPRKKETIEYVYAW